MPAFGTSVVHENKALSNLAIQFLQEKDGFIANDVAVPLTVQKESDKYFVFDRTNWKLGNDLRAAGASSNRVRQPGLSTETYLVEEYTQHDIVPIREIENADAPLQPLQDATSFLVENLMINREQRAAELLFTTTAVETIATLTAATQWDATTGSTPIDDIDLGIFTVGKQCGRKGNVVSTGDTVWRVLKNHEDILDRIKYTQTGIVTKDILASALDLDAMNIGSAVYDTTDEGIASQTIQYLWNDDKVLVNYRTKRASAKTLNHAYQFVKKGKEVMVKNWFDQDLNGQKVEVSLFYDFKIVATSCGYMITDVLV